MPELSQMPDADLVWALRTDADAAYRELERRHASSLEAAARMVLGERPACADIAAEVLEQLWCRPDRFDPRRGTLPSYLRLQARARSIDLLRSESSRKRREEVNLVARLDVHPAADVAVLAVQATAQLRRCLDHLPAAEREAIDLAYFADMPYSSVARHLGEHEGTIKGRIRSGLRRLRLTLA